MYDELQQSFETFQRNLNKLTLNVKCKTFIHSQQMTLHDMFIQKNMNPNFCQKNYALNRDAYLNGCILKREITVESPFPKIYTIQDCFCTSTWRYIITSTQPFTVCSLNKWGTHGELVSYKHEDVINSRK